MSVLSWLTCVGMYAGIGCWAGYRWFEHYSYDFRDKHWSIAVGRSIWFGIVWPVPGLALLGALLYFAVLAVYDYVVYPMFVAAFKKVDKR